MTIHQIPRPSGAPVGVSPSPRDKFPTGEKHGAPWNAQLLADELAEVERLDRNFNLWEPVNEPQIELDERNDRVHFNRNLGRVLLVGVFCGAVLIGADAIWPFETF